MANCGKPLPIPLRLEIRERLERREPVKFVARAMGLSRNTVKKYRHKRDPLPRLAG